MYFCISICISCAVLYWNGAGPRQGGGLGIIEVDDSIACNTRVENTEITKVYVGTVLFSMPP